MAEATAPTQAVVYHAGRTTRIHTSVHLQDFVTRACISLQAPHTHILAFETPSGDRAAVSTDFALRLVLAADESAGRLVLACPRDLPSVDQCMSTVLQAVVDTAARGDAAAVFLALSGAWERAALHSHVHNVHVNPSSAITPSSSPTSSPTPAPLSSSSASPSSPLPALASTRERLARACDLPDASSAAVADAACGRLDEWRLEACFCTHIGVSCAACLDDPIRGPRYRCKGVDLCERCRRAVADCADAPDVAWTVYEHPWEACDGYEDAPTPAPAPPLHYGDCGPSVLHLQYVLCRTGFLRLGRFRPGMFCGGTRDGVRWAQRDMRLGEDGVYNGCTRSCLLGKVEEVERRCGGRCATVGGTQSARMRTALAA